MLPLPGNVRANGERNPAYEHTFTFTNDFAALRPTTSETVWEDRGGLLRAEGERGTCRVLCFSPRHDLTLGEMEPSDVRRVVDVWAEESAALGVRWQWVRYSRIVARPWVRPIRTRMDRSGRGGTSARTGARGWEPPRAYFARTDRSLLIEVAALEAEGPRVVDVSEQWLAIVPFWAVWPFEMLLLPRVRIARLPELDDACRDDLASLLVRLVRRYDGLFDVPFPYSMGWHGAPFDSDAATDAWQLHAHFYPPLLRSATVRKFIVGYELLAEAQRDLLPEDAAERLRGVAI